MGPRFADVGKHGGALLADRRSVRANGVRSDGGGDDESFSIVDDEGGEGVMWALDDDFFAFDEIEDVDCALGVMLDSAGEPMAAGFNELELMQPGALFAPAFSGSYRNGLIDQIVAYPFGGAVPLNVACAMFEMDGPRSAI